MLNPIGGVNTTVAPVQITPSLFVLPDVSIAITVPVGKGFIEDRLNSNSNVALVASDEIFADGALNIQSTSSANLTIKIGTLVLRSSGSGSLGSFSPDGPSGGCGSVGVCLRVLSGNREFVSDPNGNINLAGVDIQIGGNLTALAGSQFGNVALGNVSAVGSFHANGGDISGNVSIGNINAGGTLINTTLTRQGGDVTLGNLTGGDTVVLAGVQFGDISIGNVDVVNFRTVAGKNSGDVSIGNISAGGIRINDGVTLNGDV